MINNDGFYHSDHRRQYKNEMGRTFHITGILETRYKPMLFAFFVVSAILSPLEIRWTDSVLKETNRVRPSRYANIL